MELLFLGTGAADWDIRKADASPDFRRFSSLLVDDGLLIDPGPCVYEFERTFGYEGLYRNVRDVILTHPHGDHFSRETLSRLESDGAVFHPMKAGETLELDRYVIRAYAANHRTAEDPVHFTVESKEDGKRFFYGCDGAWMFYETYRALLEYEHLDLMIFDCTIGDIRGDYRIFEHNNAVMVSEMAATFSGICSRFMVSHLARTLHPATHAETAKVLEKFGLECARDNLRVMV